MPPTMSHVDTSDEDGTNSDTNGSDSEKEPSSGGFTSKRTADNSSSQEESDSSDDSDGESGFPQISNRNSEEAGCQSDQRKGNLVPAETSSEEETDQSESSEKLAWQATSMSNHNVSESSDEDEKIDNKHKRRVLNSTTNEVSSHSSDNSLEESESSEEELELSGTDINKSNSNVTNKQDRSASVSESEKYESDESEECKSEADVSESDKEEPRVKGEPVGNDASQLSPENAETFTDENLIRYSSGVINLESLSNKNDFWLIQCPKIVSEKDLQGSKINFEMDSKVKIAGRKLQATVYPEKGSIACVLPSSQFEEYFVVGLPVKGSLVLEESVKLPDPHTLEVSSEDIVKFPPMLKERHPLFGADYKGRLQKILDSRRLSKASKKRRSGTKDTALNGIGSIGPVEDIRPLKPKAEKVSNSKRRSSSNNTNETNESRKEEINKILESFSKPHKKRKRDKDVETEFVDSFETKTSKKRKLEESQEKANVIVNHSPHETKSPKLKKRKEDLKDSSERSFLKIIANIKDEVESSNELSFSGDLTQKKKKRKSAEKP